MTTIPSWASDSRSRRTAGPTSPTPRPSTKTYPPGRRSPNFILPLRNSMIVPFSTTANSQEIDRAVDHFLVAGDRVGGQHDRVARDQIELTVGACRQSPQDRRRL